MGIHCAELTEILGCVGLMKSELKINLSWVEILWANQDVNDRSAMRELVRESRARSSWRCGSG